MHTLCVRTREIALETGGEGERKVPWVQHWLYWALCSVY